MSSKRANLLLFGLTATLPLLIFWVAELGLLRFLPPDSGAAADAIVVLGRGPIAAEQRINSAAQLWQAKRAPLVFTTGRGDAQRMIERLEAKGLPKQALDGDNCALTTLQNAVFTAAILQQQDFRTIVLVTDEPHMLRSLLVFRAQGFTVIPHPIPLPKNWGFKEKYFITLREFTGLISYGW
ncbi:MAG TPA: YdcF family protein [Coleofasciculaceae cyanobacterium]